MTKKTDAKIMLMASGNGSNFEAIAKACKEGLIQANVVKLICDQPNAYVFERAKKLSIPAQCIDFKSFEQRKQFNEALLVACKAVNPDFIVLAGFMKILSPEFVNHFKNKIINIHPSLLPKYPGIRALEKAWNNKESESGVTVHYVDEGVDTGQVILQKSVAIDYDQSFEVFCQSVHAVEHDTYVKALQKIVNRL